VASWNWRYNFPAKRMLAVNEVSQEEQSCGLVVKSYEVEVRTFHVFSIQ
jgi:hypothetical protein